MARAMCHVAHRQRCGLVGDRLAENIAVQKHRCEPRAARVGRKVAHVGPGGTTLVNVLAQKLAIYANTRDVGIQY